MALGVMLDAELGGGSGGSRFGGQSCPLSFPITNVLEGACVCPAVPWGLEGFSVWERATGCCACFSPALMLWVSHAFPSCGSCFSQFTQ